eukprot:CAMPEP_0174837642 /NCGR_PEP_ID=MMETSP1114-20130205/6877_1 /TAXON_ID=312471 /ORGANISM="Neobodo designis, Strain CCAP 1951/1" /LENGTH=281 /DNA_ID=CAMNT_0016071713 /DNA_START=45 /DNA_END=890 /DNA_ORIENTATION=+
MVWFLSWTKPTAESVAHQNQALRKDAAVSLVAFLVIWYLCTTDAQPEELVQKTSPTVAATAALLVAAIASLVLDVKLAPPPTPADVMVWRALGTPLGHCSYFTVQTLFLHCIYLAIALYGEVTGSATARTAVCALCVWVTTQAIALAGLFLAHNWFERRWQEEVHAPLEVKYPGWGALMLTTHLLPAVVALIDFFVVRDAAAVLARGPSMSTMVAVAFGYGVAYTAWMKLVQHVLSPGTLMYPFVSDLHSVGKCASFVGAQGAAIAVLSCVLMIARPYVGA